MAQKINLNVSPYYDDFDAEKNFYKVLFKPGTPVQARELTTLQTILQNQIQSFGSNIFKDGSVVVPGNITYDPDYYAVKINLFHLGLDVEFYVENLIGKKIIGQTSKISAIVQNVIKRTDSSLSTTTLYVKYLSSDSNFQTSKFIDGETLITQDTFSYGNTTITSGSTIASLIESNSTSTASSVSIAPGIYFIRGFFVNVSQDTLILDQYTNTPSYRIGLEIIEDLTTSYEDSSLYDNAKGFTNYAAPGSDRLKINTKLSKKSLTDFNDQNFIEILRITDGQVKKIKDTSDYSLIKDYLAKRTYEESGNYSLAPFEIDVVDSLNNLSDSNGLFLASEKTEELNTPSEDLLSIKVSSGKAYVGGFDIEKSGATVLDVIKTREVETVASTSIPFEMGNLIVVNNVSGAPVIGINNDYTVELYNQRKIGNSSASGTKIGEARVYSFSVSDAPYENKKTNWNLYLYDVQTYTVLTLNSNISSQDCPPTSYIKGSSSGASGYVVGSPSGGDITLSQTSGSFISGEQIIVNGDNSISRSIKSLRAYAVDDIKSLYQDSSTMGLPSDFSADTFLEKKTPSNFRVSDRIIITARSGGISTVTSPGNNFIGIKSDTIIRYQVAGLSTETYNRISSVSADGLSMICVGVGTTVAGVCISDLPTSETTTSFTLGIPSIKNTQKSSLYSNLSNTNISEVNLSNSQLTFKKQITGKSTSSSGTLSLTTSDVGVANCSFEPFNTQRYSIFYSDGTIELLSYDKVLVENNGQNISFSGISASKSATIDVTVTKNIIKNKKKLSTRSQKIQISKTAETRNKNVSGLSTNQYYGLRVEDEEISLSVPDVYKVIAIYESLDSSSPILDKLTFSSGLNLDTNSILGEKIIGSTSGAVGQIVTRSSSTQIEFVYLNKNKFQSGETVKFDESKISSSLVSIDVGSYIDRTENYDLDKGQKDQYYDYSRIIRKNGRIPSKNLLVIYDCYIVPSNDIGDLYTANSYDSERFKFDIPLLKNQLRASDTFDLRPRVSQFTSISKSPFAFSSRNFSESGVNPPLVVAPNESSSVGYSYYVPRIDKLILDKSGDFKLIKGIATSNPKEPESSQDSMDIATIKIPAYVYNVDDISISLIENKRYTMKDIGKLDDRIKNLENLTSLSLIELDTKSLQITDADGLLKFKSGFFADNFRDNKFIDIANQDSNSTVNTSLEELTSDISIYSLKSKIYPNETVNSESEDFSANISLLDPNIKKTGDLLTLNYSEVEWGDVSQLFATKKESINLSGLTDYNGYVKLRPSSDAWVRTINTDGKVIIKSQSEWKDSFISNLISSSKFNNKIRSRNVEFTVGNLYPNTQYYSSLDSRNDVDIIPKLLQVSMITGVFQSDEIVEGYVGSEKLACFRLSNTNHKFGRYNLPDEIYSENPYSPSNILNSYSQSSSILNIDTYSLSDNSDGRFYGYVPFGMILVGKTSKAQATVSNQSLISDSVGDLIGCFFIRDPLSNPTPQTTFNVGTKTFRISQTSGFNSTSTVNYCETNFYTNGSPQSYTNNFIIRRPVLSKSFKNITKDPLTQTFRTDNSGGFLTSLDLFFAEKDNSEKLTIEIKEVDLGGSPTNNVVQDFSRVQISPSKIIISADGETPTNIKLPSPLYLEPNKQYAISLNSPSSQNYKVWIAESNKPTVATQNYPNALQVTYSNQYVGGNLYKPQNGTTPISSPFEDLKFRLYKAKFSSKSGTAYFMNPDLSGSGSGDDYDFNIQKLTNNPITMYPRKLIVGILTSTNLSTILTVGTKVAEGAKYGYIEKVGGNISGISTSNVGSGYSSGAYTSVPLYTITGYGSSATANITFASNGTVSVVSIANTGNGYAVGDLLGITTSSVSKGRGATISVSSISTIDTLRLTNVKGQSFTTNNSISYYDGNTLVSLSGTTVKSTSLVNDLYRGDVIRVNQYNHGMHSLSNKVTISGVFPDTVPEKLTVAIVPSSLTIGVANTATFTTFEGSVGVNTGYILINNEIISYDSVGSGVLNISTNGRGINGSTTRNHSINDLVYKYELNGMSLVRINTTHEIPDDSSLLTSLGDIDNYYLKLFGVSNNTIYFNEEKTSGSSNCKATQNFQYNSIIPQFNTLSPQNTSINASLRSITGTSAGGSEISFSDNAYESVSLNNNNELNSPRMICSKINETTNLTFMPRSKSLILNISMDTTDENVSPVIDITESGTFILSRNRINNPISNYVSDSRSNNLIGDPHSSVYVSNRIDLLQPATSLKVITNACRNSSSDFRVLYRLFKSDSSEIEQSYQLFPGYNNLKDLNGDGVGDIIIDQSLNDGSSDIFVSSDENNNFSEYQFSADNLEEFNGFAIKIVMSGTNEAYPLRFRDIRVVALA